MEDLRIVLVNHWQIQGSTACSATFAQCLQLEVLIKLKVGRRKTPCQKKRKEGNHIQIGAS
jgi:hypothetical protein